EDKLIKASRNGDIEIIDQLIKSGVDINYQDKFGSSPLIEAVRGNQTSVVKFLLDHKADPNLKDKAGDTAILIASTMNNTENVTMILTKGAIVNVTDKNGSSPLMISTARENYKSVRLMINKGADIYLKNKDGKSAYDIAVGNRNDPIINLLKQVGGEKLAAKIRTEEADSKKQLLTSSIDNQRNWSPLMYAAWRGDQEALKLALKTNSDLEQTDTSGLTALSLAARGGHVGVINLLLAAGADQRCEKNDSNPLMLSIKSDKPESVKSLISPLISRTDCKAFLEKMLSQSLETGRLDIAEIFFKNGISLNNQTGVSPLISMASNSDDETIKTLIANGADINAEDEHGLTALMAAAKSGNLDVVKTLVELKAEIEKKDKSGRTALIHSALNNQADVLNYLIEKGANVFTLTQENNTALMLAAKNGYLPVVEILADFKNLDQKNNVGDTALIMAVRGRFLQVSDVLLKNGANPRISNNRKEKALSLVQSEDGELHDLIEKYASSRSWIKDIF
ncbi:MAG: ankyrin repeat domain-containing protein, partial [Alphaproteobacteria bacterium]|nr:ankyrin repeat domain-containing protein [Alphaproteobacteria bacterium]